MVGNVRMQESIEEHHPIRMTEGLEYVIIFAHRKFVRKHDGREQLIENSVNVSQI